MEWKPSKKSWLPLKVSKHHKLRYFGNQLILFTIECKIIGYIENIDSIIGLEYLYFLYLDLSNICMRVGFHKNI